MKRSRTQTHHLIALNAILLLVLGAVVFAPLAEAQNRRGQQIRRAPGDYTMIAARPLGFSEDALHIVDATNMEYLAVRFDRTRGNLIFLDFRDLQADLEAAVNQGR